MRSGYPQIFSTLSGETMHQTLKSFTGTRRALGPLSPCQVWWGSDFTRRQAAKKVEFSCLSGLEWSLLAGMGNTLEQFKVSIRVRVS